MYLHPSKKYNLPFKSKTCQDLKYLLHEFYSMFLFFCAEITIMRNQFFYWISLKIYPLYARKRKNSLLCFCDKSCVLKKHQICHISQSWDKDCWYIRIGLMRHRNLNTLSYSLYLVMYKYPLNLRQLGLSFSFGEQDENVKHLRKHYSWKWRRVDDDDDEDDDDTGGKKKKTTRKY